MRLNIRQIKKIKWRKKDTVYSNKICVLRSWRILCSLRWRKECFHIRGTSKIFSKNFQFLIAYSNNFSRFVDHCICSVEERIMYVSYTLSRKKKSKVSLSYISAMQKEAEDTFANDNGQKTRNFSRVSFR